MAIRCGGSRGSGATARSTSDELTRTTAATTT